MKIDWLANSNALSPNRNPLTRELLSQETDEPVAIQLGHNATDILLSVRLVGRKSGYHLRFPIGRTDAVKSNADKVIESLDEFRQLGIKFRTNNDRWTKQQGEWIGPESQQSKEEA